MSEKELKNSLRRYRRATAIFCSIGLILAYYAVYIEFAKSEDPSYQALCDISETISCSKVFISEYGKGFGILGKIFGKTSVLNQPNGVYGMIMYPVFVFLSLFAVSLFALLELVMGVGGVIVSIYLGYVLFYILEDMCVVCVTSYTINFFLFVCAFLNYRAVKKLNEKKETVNITGYLDGKTKKRV